MVCLRRSGWVGPAATTGVAVCCSGSPTNKTTLDGAGDGGATDAGAPHSAATAVASPGGDTDQPGSGGASGASGGASGAGGDGAAGTTDGWLSGTRLRAVLDVAGSSKLFKTWHDDLLDIDCSFAIDADNVERCLPTPKHFTQ